MPKKSRGACLSMMLDAHFFSEDLSTDVYNGCLVAIVSVDVLQ